MSKIKYFLIIMQLNWKCPLICSFIFYKPLVFLDGCTHLPGEAETLLDLFIYLFRSIAGLYLPSKYEDSQNNLVKRTEP